MEKQQAWRDSNACILLSLFCYHYLVVVPLFSASLSLISTMCVCGGRKVRDDGSVFSDNI